MAIMLFTKSTNFQWREKRKIKSRPQGVFLLHSVKCTVYIGTGPKLWNLCEQLCVFLRKFMTELAPECTPITSRLISLLVIKFCLCLRKSLIISKSEPKIKSAIYCLNLFFVVFCQNSHQFMHKSQIYVNDILGAVNANADRNRNAPLEKQISFLSS